METNRTITFQVTNKFYNKRIFSVEMPYYPFKAMFGYYSWFVRRLKKSNVFADNGVRDLIVFRHYFTNKITDRIIYRFNSGAMLDMPADATSYDYEIVQAQLNVLMMKFQKPHTKPQPHAIERKN